MYQNNFLIVAAFYILCPNHIHTQEAITYKKVTPDTIAANSYKIIHKARSHLIVKDHSNNYHELLFSHKTKTFTLLNYQHPCYVQLDSSESDDENNNNKSIEQLHDPLRYIYLTPTDNCIASKRIRAKRIRAESDIESDIKSTTESERSISSTSTIVVQNIHAQESRDYESFAKSKIEEIGEISL